MGTINRAPPASKGPAAKDCLDCTISRLGGARLCRQHWLEFQLWLVDGVRTVEYRAADPAERDRMVREWVMTGGGP